MLQRFAIDAAMLMTTVTLHRAVSAVQHTPFCPRFIKHRTTHTHGTCAPGEQQHHQRGHIAWRRRQFVCFRANCNTISVSVLVLVSWRERERERWGGGWGGGY